jgi:hypothetical protein
MKTILFDFVNGIKIPIGKVEMVRNIATSGPCVHFEETVGLWRLKDGDFYVCKRRDASFNKEETWAEVITENEAKYIAVKNPDLYSQFFVDLPEIECESLPGADTLSTSAPALQ